MKTARALIRRSLRMAVAIGIVAICATFSCTGPRPPEGKVLIEFWDFPRLPEVDLWLREQIRLYEEQNPHVQIEYTQLSWAKGGERLDIAAFARRPPDVAGAVLQVKYAEANLLAPLDRYLDEEIPDSGGKTYREDIHAGILKSVQWDGQTWSFPWYKEAFVILLNKKLLDDEGVEPPANGQWTWDEFLARMHRLTLDRNRDGKTDLYGTGFSTGPQKWEAYSFLFAEGMEILSDDGRKILVDSEATRRGIQRLLDLEYSEKVSLPGAGGIMDDTTWTAFSGRDRTLASTCQGLWSIRAVDTMNKRREEFIQKEPDAQGLADHLDVTIALYPIMPGQPQRMASYGVGSLMVFDQPDDPRRTEEAARFARYITLEAGQEINRAAGLFPSRISTPYLFEDDPRFKDVWPHIADAISPPTHPAWPQLDQVIGENLQLILLQRIGLDEGVRRMGERCQYILDDYWDMRDAAKQ